MGNRFEDEYEKTLEVEGFAEYLTDSGGGCPFFDARVKVTGSHENCQFRLGAPGVPGQLESVHARHVLVGEENCVRPFYKQFHGFFATSRTRDVNAFAFESQFHEEEYVAVIINNEDALSWVGVSDPVLLNSVHESLSCGVCESCSVVRQYDHQSYLSILKMTYYHILNRVDIVGAKGVYHLRYGDPEPESIKNSPLFIGPLKDAWGVVVEL